jgi:competence protein ComFC
VAAVKIDPLRLEGPWADGYVLERQHTLSSEFLGHDSFGHPRFDTKRSELGELVFLLKNRSDRATLGPLAETAAAFVNQWHVAIDVIVPVPPSRKREFQPVVEIADRLGEQLLKPSLVSAVTKIQETPELKDVFGYAERRKLLEGAFAVDGGAVQGLRVLLVDDLYRSGATAAVVARELLSAGAGAVYFLAMTKTRTRS